MRQLLPEKEKEDPGCLFRALFLRQLPADVWAHLADKRNLPLLSLAEEADQFYSSAEVKVAAVQERSPKQHVTKQVRNRKSGKHDRKSGGKCHQAL